MKTKKKTIVILIHQAKYDAESYPCASMKVADRKAAQLIMEDISSVESAELSIRKMHDREGAEPEAHAFISSQLRRLYKAKKYGVLVAIWQTWQEHFNEQEWGHEYMSFSRKRVIG